MATVPRVDTAFETSNATRPPNDLTPTTSRPARLTIDGPHPQDRDDDAVLRTPVQQQFVGSLADSALRDQPMTPSTTHTTQSEPVQSLKRDGSQRSPPPTPGTAAHDVDMLDGEDDGGLEDDGSDNDSAAGDSQRPSKKKKGQRFFCTEFPPCQLSFTRSEHLARHIRKHTGERPFQCHCSRRFSRLDNLRQHAQTVHLNEDIPGDSLAATSTRFQRQIRTDRARPPTSRSRASTLGSNGGHSRGHSRNLSTSSIASTASSMSIAEDVRRRPQPLAMAQDGSSRARLTIDTYNNAMASSPIQGQYGYQTQTPSGYSSPTSTTFSIGTGSPRFQSGMASPVSTMSRSSYYNGARQARRLSVPSGSNPFQNAHTGTYPQPMYYNPGVAGSPVLYSQNSSVFASPTSSMFSHSRRDSETEMEMRRRTWHPSTYSNYLQRPPTSGLSYQQTPDDHHTPIPSQQAASRVTRLPGIESFDHAPAGGRQQAEAVAMETIPRPPSSGRPSDAGLHQNLTRLDIAAANAPVEGQWQHVHPAQMTTQPYMGQPPATVAPQHVQPQPPSTAPHMAEPPVTPRRNKRQAWYGGPVSGPITPHSNAQPAHRPSPEDSGSSDGVPTPGTSQGIEYHPVIVNPHGTTEAYAGAAVGPDEHKSYVHPHDAAAAAAAHTYALQAGHDPRFATSYAAAPANNDMGRLEALVAVATSENRAVERS